MRLEEALNIRYMQRRKYLENENYERLSDILSDEGNNPYRGRRDNYMFINLLNGNDYDEVSVSRWAMEELFLEKYNRSGINWAGIYNYYQARLTSLRNGEWDEPEEPDIENVVDILEAHKDKILVVYNPY